MRGLQGSPTTGTVLSTSSSSVRLRRRHAFAAGGSCSFKIKSTPGAPSLACWSFSSCKASAVLFTSITCSRLEAYRLVLDIQTQFQDMPALPSHMFALTAPQRTW